MMDGEYGKDFWITFQGDNMIYNQGQLKHLNGQELSAKEKEELLSTSNKASTYVYLLSFLHLLHLIGGLLYLMSVIIRVNKKELDVDSERKIKMAGIYWHFLDGLWLYLFLFLFFIH